MTESGGWGNGPLTIPEIVYIIVSGGSDLLSDLRAKFLD
jgi:hypothetical protein